MILKKTNESKSILNRMLDNISISKGTAALSSLALTVSLFGQDIPTSELASFDSKVGVAAEKLVDESGDFFKANKIKMLTKDNYRDYIDSFKTKSDNLIVIIDGGKHAKGTTEIILENAKKVNLDADVIHIPRYFLGELKAELSKKLELAHGELTTSEKIDKYLNEYDKLDKDSRSLLSTQVPLENIYKYLGSHFKDKKVIINESFTKDFTKYIPNEFQFDEENNFTKSSKIQEVLNNNYGYMDYVIQILNDNPNLMISKGSGNSTSLYNADFNVGDGSNRLMSEHTTREYFKYSSGDIKKMTLISEAALKFVEKEDKFDSTTTDKFREKILEINPSIDKDLLSHRHLNKFLNVNAVEYVLNIDDLHNNNFMNKNSNLHMVNAINLDSLKTNIKLTQEENPNCLVPKKITSYVNSGKADVSTLKTLISNYRESSPELFLPKYSSPITFALTNGIKDLNLKAIGQVTKAYGYMLGTSEATPSFSIDLSKKYEKEINFGDGYKVAEIQNIAAGYRSINLDTPKSTYQEIPIESKMVESNYAFNTKEFFTKVKIIENSTSSMTTNINIKNQNSANNFLNSSIENVELKIQEIKNQLESIVME